MLLYNYLRQDDSFVRNTALLREPKPAKVANKKHFMSLQQKKKRKERKKKFVGPNLMSVCLVYYFFNDRGEILVFYLPRKKLIVCIRRFSQCHPESDAV